ncbi:DUF3574 domain-containing protein [Kozakia baliensis]|uniref:DUF3574 domain-containing protein n=1 Tax=Kozakia baliensis TaxID=153496 RepID=UPI001D045CCF|nr:DUF3574 domain-containing protein [Kozakia baliensis]
MAYGTHADRQIQMLFGLSRPDGTPVTEKEWQDFLAEVVTPLFPNGFSVINASGQWQDRMSHRVTHEDSRLLWIATPENRDLGHRVAIIRDAYKARFQQQSVGLLIQAGCEAF